MAKNKQGKLRVIPLGGLGEIGRNMMLLEYGGSITCTSVCLCSLASFSRTCTRPAVRRVQ